MPVIQASEPFRQLTEQAVMDALNDPDADNPIAAELSRLIFGYTANFQRHVSQLGRFPSSTLRAKGSCPIEEVAMRLVTEEIKGALANK